MGHSFAGLTITGVADRLRSRIAHLVYLDALRAADYVKSIGMNTSLERRKLFWRGDRIEWLLARGFHDWFMGEIKAGRVLWPD